MTKTKTFGEDPERATQETCDHWDIWSEWWGDMTWPTKKTKAKTMTKTKTMKNTSIFREHLHRAILDPCDLWDIWSEWWGDMAWLKNRQRQIQTQRQRQIQIHLGNTFKEWSQDGKVVFAPKNKLILWFCLTFPSFEHKLHSTVQLKMCKNSVKTVLHTLYSFKILNAEALLKLVQHFEIVWTFWNCVKILKLCEHFEIRLKLWK